MNKLIKVKLTIETEFVGENVYGETDFKKVGREVFLANQNGIINQAIETGEYTIKSKEIDKLSELPVGWDINCLPWSNIKSKNIKIKEYLKNEQEKI